MNWDWHKTANEWWKQQPHPQSDSLNIGEYSQAVKLATQTKFGGHATSQEADAFWQEFQQMNDTLKRQNKQPISPEEFGHLLDDIAPVSYAFHGRPPTMQELGKLRDAHPKDVRSHYYHLPDKHYPHVTAGDMIAAMEKGRPWARMHLKRDPVKTEAAYLAHSGDNPNHFFRVLAEEAKGQQDQGWYGDLPFRQQGDDARQPDAKSR